MSIMESDEHQHQEEPATDGGKPPFAFRCLICGKALSDCSGNGTLEDGLDGSRLLPSGAIEMTSYGHYGTTFFDPCDDGTQVAALICDACMEARSDRLMFIDANRRLSPYDEAMERLRAQVAEARALWEASHGAGGDGAGRGDGDRKER